MGETRVTIDQAVVMAAEHFKAGRLADAEGIYRAVLNAQPNHLVANHNLGLIAHHVGKNEIAVDLFRKAISINANVSALHNNLGEALRALGRFDDAITAYQQALSLEPNDPVASNNLGIALLSAGRKAEAGESFRQAVEYKPDYFEARLSLAQILLSEKRTQDAVRELDAAALFARAPGFPLSKLGMLYARARRSDYARKYLKAALERDPADSDGSGLVLAALDNEGIPARASEAYMQKLYAGRAKNWDNATADEQSYRGVVLVARELRRLGGTGIDVLDAGCGTGLIGVQVRDIAVRLEGVDLSEGMLVKAREKGVYDLLSHGDLIEFMRANPSRYDAIISAATLIHFGDLAPVFEAVASALKPGGLFIFTVFPNDDEDSYSIGHLDGLAEGGCYVHGKSYLVRLATEFGFKVETLGREIHEYREGEPAMGLIAALRQDEQSRITHR